MFRLFFSISLLMGTMTFAQNVLSGYVKDDEEQPFKNIRVTIEQTTQAASTDEYGFYIIRNIAPGTYALSIDYLYDKKYFTVIISTENTNFNISLTRRIEFDEVLVKSYQMDVSRYSNASYLNSDLLQSIENEKDLPYLLKHVSGIVVQSDAGNGVGYSGVRLRGLDPAHVQININGIPFNDSESALSYFVDIPDIISQTDDITVLKGNVPNRSGTPSFGGAIDINTNKLIFQPFLMTKSQFGSFNTWKYSLQANSGLIANKFNFEFGLSRQKSDGYIDRSDADLKSFRFSGAIIKKNYALRVHYMHGNEKTGQAWFGLPIQYELIDSLRQYNRAGTEKPGVPYKDEKDNYKQDHIQLFYQNQLNAKMIFNSSFNYTRGSGYYENYKANQELQFYYIESPGSTHADLVQRQWLENNFFFVNASLIFNLTNKFSVTPSMSWSHYKGDHFGSVSKLLLTEYIFNKNRYYNNVGFKKEFSACIKSSYELFKNFNINVDLQYRKIDYTIVGDLQSHDSIRIDKKYHLFNPKLFASYSVNANWDLYSSIGVMQREPFRQDLIGQIADLQPERLFDVEAGFKYNSPKISLKVNGYLMKYKGQLALSGKISDVGEALRINLDKSFRLGMEVEADLKITDWLSIWNASNLSINEIKTIKEFIPVYSQTEPIFYNEIEHSNTSISFSPSRVINSGIQITLTKEKRRMPNTSLSVSHYYVSEFYVDNFSLQSSLLESYYNIESSLKIHKSFLKIGTLTLRLTIYNLLDNKYSSHGWISKFGSKDPVDLSSDPYLATESKELYYYKGIFPQALRHFNIGVGFKFH